MQETKTIETATKIGGSIKDIAEYAEVVAKHKMQKVATPIFIIFAEYLGYVSQFNKMAEDWCDGKVPEAHVQKIMILEASCIFRQMKKDYDLDEIKYYYDSYYPLILKEYVDNLASIMEK